MTPPGSLRTLTRETVYYGLGGALQKLISFLLFPIYTRILSKQDFGSQDLVLTAFSIAYMLLMLGLDNGAARLYYDTGEESERSLLLSTWLWFSVGVSTLAAGLLLVASRPLCVFLFQNASLVLPFRLAILSIPAAVVAKVAMLALRLKFRARAFSSVTLAYVVSVGLSSVVFVVIMRLGVPGVFYANLVASVVQLVISFVVARRCFRLAFSSRLLKGMLVFGLPTVPASISLWVLSSSNRYLLVRFVTLADIGMFAVAGRIASILTFFITAFQMAWPMFAFSIHKDTDRAPAVYSRVLEAYCLLTLSMAVGVIVFAREFIIVLASPSYSSASLYVPFLVLGVVAWGAADIVGIGYSIAKRSYHLTIATVIGATLNTVANITLIPVLGLLGASVAMALGYAGTFLYSLWAGRRFVVIAVNAKKYGMLLGVAVLLFVTTCLVDIWAHLTALVLMAKVALILLFGVTVWLSKAVTPAMLRGVRDAIRARRT